MLTAEHQEYARKHGWDVVVCIDSKTQRVFFDLSLYPQAERWDRHRLFQGISQRARGGDAAAVATLKLLASPVTKTRKRS